jgi:hypothetical protein
MESPEPSQQILLRCRCILVATTKGALQKSFRYCSAVHDADLRIAIPFCSYIRLIAANGDVIDNQNYDIAVCCNEPTVLWVWIREVL